MAQKTTQPPATDAEKAAGAPGGLLNTEDVKTGIEYVVTRGRGGPATAQDFQFIFEAKSKAAGLIGQNETLSNLAESGAAKKGAATISSLLDMDGDGKVTPKDFVIMFDRHMAFLDTHRSQFDRYLPFAGQCMFGLLVGYAFGRTAKFFYAYKLPIVISGFLAYNVGQWFLQQGYVNRELLKQEFETKLKEAADINKDGSLNRDDIAQLIDHRMSIVNQKLGPGGFAPGICGGLTFGLGLLKGFFRYKLFFR